MVEGVRVSQGAVSLAATAPGQVSKGKLVQGEGQTQSDSQTLYNKAKKELQHLTLTQNREAEAPSWSQTWGESVWWNGLDP